MNLSESYFAITNPIDILDRWLNPYCYQTKVRLRNRDLIIKWSRRVQQQLDNMTFTLTIEMQLYFSCVVKKRVLFHEQSVPDSINVNDKLKVDFRLVQSDSCSPEEFAKNYPVKRELDSAAAMKVAPSVLKIDFKNGCWSGDFSV